MGDGLMAQEPTEDSGGLLSQKLKIDSVWLLSQTENQSTHLDIHYVLVHSKNYVSEKAKNDLQFGTEVIKCNGTKFGSGKKK